MAITNLSVDATYIGGTKLTWFGLSGSGTFYIYKVDSSATTLLGTVTSGSAVINSFIDSDVVPELCGVETVYLVRSLSIDTEGAEEAAITYTNTCRPDNFSSVDYICNESPTLEWNIYSGTIDSSYISVRIYRTDNNWATSTLITELPIETISYTDSSALAARRYIYRIVYVFSYGDYSIESVAFTTSTCQTPNGPCGDYGIITSWDYKAYANDCTIVLENIVVAGELAVPQSSVCYDVASVYSQTLATLDCSGNVLKEGIILDSNSIYYNPVTDRIEIPSTQHGMYKLRLTTKYYDSNGRLITINTTKCVFIPCGIACKIADNIDLIMLYEGIRLNAECGNCDKACAMYNTLIKQLDGCNC